MIKIFEPDINALTPYVPGKPVEELQRELGLARVIKLASNENPFGPSPRALEAAREAAARAHIYPDGSAYHLKQALAERLGVTPAELLISNGSNEAIELIAQVLAAPGAEAVLSQTSFVVYRLACLAAGLRTREAPLGPGMRCDLDAMAAAITPATRVVFIANPNNPTGTYARRDALERFLERVPEGVLVVLDEAYFEYAGAADYPSGLALRARFPRLMVMRTFSKCYGLAGLRVGYTVGAPDQIEQLNRVRAPFNTSLVGQAAARAALDDEAFLKRSVTHNEAARARLLAGLDARGLEAVESETNFVLVRTPQPGAEVFEALLRQGVIVRPMDGYDLPHHLRISVGLDEELDALLAALDRVLGG